MRILDIRRLTVEKAFAMLAIDRGSLEVTMPVVREIVETVKVQGDAALSAYAERFDGVRPAKLVLGRSDLETALGRIPAALRNALVFAADQIRAFHRPQLRVGYETRIGKHGSRAGMWPVPLERVGVYVPGGPRGYPSTALMGCIPASLAGVREIVVATPPARDSGLPPDPVLAAASLGGAHEVVVSGGAQAIAALAYGTQSVRPVDKIVGPGNTYVSAAKLIVQGIVSTDGVAGPSEVLVIADDALPTDALASELVAQAEHDSSAVAVAILVGSRDPDQVLGAVRDATARLPERTRIEETLRGRGAILVAASASQAIELANRIAPEHLVLAIRDASALRYAVRNAGCVFLGRWSSAPFGDYTAGTNHVLPTSGTSRSRGGLGVADFMKFLSYVEIDAADASALAAPAARIARAEGFEAHAAAL